MEPILLDAVPELEPAVFDERARFEEAVVNRAVLDPAAAAALAQVGQVHPSQPAQGDDLRQVEGAAVFRGDEHRVWIDLRFDQADQVFNDCANGFQFLRLKRTFPLDTYRSRTGCVGRDQRAERIVSQYI